MAKQLVISDATALIALINIESFSLLEAFASKIIIPEEVYEEISVFDDAKSFLDEKIKVQMVQIAKVKNKEFYQELKIRLDSGESAAIALAIEQKLPLIIDEKRGRSIAKSIDVEIIGVIGIIKAQYKIKRVSKEDVEKLIDKLNRSDFRVTKKLFDMILKDDDEQL